MPKISIADLLTNILAQQIFSVIYVEYFNELTLKYTNPVKTIIGPKLVLSDYPNKLLQIASSDIFMNLGDDMRC